MKATSISVLAAAFLIATAAQAGVAPSHDSSQLSQSGAKIAPPSKNAEPAKKDEKDKEQDKDQKR
jgi:hypothetical protein